MTLRDERIAVGGGKLGALGRAVVVFAQLDGLRRRLVGGDRCQAGRGQCDRRAGAQATDGRHRRTRGTRPRAVRADA